uniref:Uncharacterized protein n=1 Tax=Anguilla anguilla TaxID=7936 RepID=A0A0E9QW82_ANGAN
MCACVRACMALINIRCAMQMVWHFFLKSNLSSMPYYHTCTHTFPSDN